MRLPKTTFEKAVKISNQEYYKNETMLTGVCYSDLISIIKNCDDWEECVRQVKFRIMVYSGGIEKIELKGMRLIEECLKELGFSGIDRAATQIKTREGFNGFVRKFDKKQRHVLSFNWSDVLIQLICPQIPRENIISNRLRYKGGECIGFDWSRVFLTPEQKFDHFKRIKTDKNIFCGDSLPDLLPSLYSDIAFAFPSHDKEFLAICNKLREKFSRQIYIVKDFNDAGRILEKLSF